MNKFGENGNRNMSGRVTAMTGNVAQRIRRWMEHHEVVRMGGRGKCNWSSIGTLMRSDVKMANRMENTDRPAGRSSLPR